MLWYHRVPVGRGGTVPEDAPSRCPQCDGPLQVAALHCPHCDLTLTGEFARCRFCELSPEHREFLEAFIRCRGVIRQMEQELGISYPTVKSRMDDLLRGLRFDGPGTPGVADSIRDVLQELDRGECSAEEAVARIRALRGKS
jgi:hypothetical protein